jgi:hypothetical protein
MVMLYMLPKKEYTMKFLWFYDDIRCHVSDYLYDCENRNIFPSIKGFMMHLQEKFRKQAYEE